MKYVATVKVTVLRKIEETGKNDPSKKYNYLMIMQDSDAGKVYVPKEVYDAVKEGENVALVAEVNPNSQYESGIFRFVGVARPVAKQ